MIDILNGSASTLSMAFALAGWLVLSAGPLVAGTPLDQLVSCPKGAFAWFDLSNSTLIGEDWFIEARPALLMHCRHGGCFCAISSGQVGFSGTPPCEIQACNDGWWVTLIDTCCL